MHWMRNVSKARTLISIVLITAMVGAGAYALVRDALTETAVAVAEVNGAYITKERFYAELDRRGVTATGMHRDTLVSILNGLIDARLIEAAAADVEVAIEAPVIDEHYQEIRQRFTSQEEFEAELASNFHTPESFRDAVRIDLLAQLLVRESISPNLLRANQADIERAYAELADPPPLDEIREDVAARVEFQRMRQYKEELRNWLRESASIRIDINGFETAL